MILEFVTALALEILKDLRTSFHFLSRSHI